MNRLAMALAATVLAWCAGDADAAARYAVVDRIAGPDGPFDYVRVDAGHDQLLVPRGSAVMTLQLSSRKLTGGLAPGGRQHIALPLPGGHEMLVTNAATDTAAFADEVTGQVLASAPVAKGPDAAVFDPRSGLALVVGHLGGAVTLVDPRRHEALGDIAVGGKLEEIAADGAGHAFVNVEDRNEVAVLDLAARKTTARWPVPACDGPTGLAYDAADGLLVVACDGTTAILRAATGKLVQTLNTGKGADGAVFDARRRLAFVPAGRDGVLNVIAIDKGRSRLVQKVQTQVGARTLALDERSGRLYLPSAAYAFPAGGRPTPLPGTFHILVVAPRP